MAERVSSMMFWILRLGGGVHYIGGIVQLVWFLGGGRMEEVGGGQGEEEA